MPRGGIDPGEDLTAAALRELYEETGIDKAEILAESAGWLTYDLPDYLIGVALKGKFRGQRQKWFAAASPARTRTCGSTCTILSSTPGNGPRRGLPGLIVPFKRAIVTAPSSTGSAPSPAASPKASPLRAAKAAIRASMSGPRPSPR